MWYMTELSHIGSCHQKNGGVCQDATSVTRTVQADVIPEAPGAVRENHVGSAGCGLPYIPETYVIALADGAGSAPRSEAGARIAVEYISSFLASGFESIYRQKNAEIVKKELIRGLRRKLREQAGHDGMPLKAYASTLLAVAVRDGRYIIVHLGDGVIGYLKDRRLVVASAPDNGEFANVTYFTTSNRAWQVIRMFKGELHDIQGFLLMSDGAEPSLYSHSNNKLAPALIDAMHVSAVLSDEMTKRTIEEWFLSAVATQTADDCSLVMMVSDRAFSSFREMNAGVRRKLFGVQSVKKNEKLMPARMNAVMTEIQGRGNDGITECELKRTQKMCRTDLQRTLEMLVSLHLVYRENYRIYSGLR